MIRGALLGLAASLCVACGAPSSDVEPPSEATATPALDNTGDTTTTVDRGVDDAGATPDGEETMVQPEWDALDRVQDTCGLARVLRFRGRAVDEIDLESLPEGTRVLSPTTQATMDYVPRRLNILTNGNGLVIGFKCG